MAGGLVLLAVGAWASGRVPEHLVAVAFFLLAVLLGVAPPEVVFSGFTSGALWLIFGGQIMGIAIRHTGLARRMADAAARRIGARGYGSVIAGVVALGTVLSFFMPSAMGRVALLMPIAGALADRYGFRGAGNGRTGILLAAAFGTTVPAMAVLPANVPNAVLAGAAERHGVTLGYLEYLLLHFPVLGAARAAVVALLVVLVFPDRLRPQAAEEARPTPLSRQERAVAGLVALALALWATDAIHHVPAAWVSLGVGLALLVPRVGLVPPRAFNEQVNYASLFFVAGVMGVGAVMAHVGLGDALGRLARTAFPLAPGAGALNFASLAGIGTVIGLATTAPGMPAVMTPLAEALSGASGLPLRTVLMAEVLGFSNNLFPYQSPPLVVAAQLSSLPTRSVVALSLALGAVTMLVLFPLDYLWWRALGWM